ncbi:MAG: thioesterase family protein [Hymenobacteraceae bacterium]|nr:thioesterase family protein [Hymenobacteraceae bacterium]
MVESFHFRWADLDPNGHVRHSVYADIAAQTRVAFLGAAGFGLRQFAQLGLGPILLREDVRYLKEIHLDDVVTVEALVSGLTADGARWHLQHTFTRARDGAVVATVAVEGAWFDLKTRRVASPPPTLAEAMRTAARHASYQDIVRQPKPAEQ